MREPAKPLQLGDRVFVTSPLPANKALRVLTRLTKLVGQTILEIAARGKESLDALPDDVVSFAVQALVERLDEDEIETTVRQLLEGMRMRGADEDVDKIWSELFAGRIMELFSVLQYALEVNYSDFFDVLRSQRTRRTAEEQPKGSAQQTSTATSATS